MSQRREIENRLALYDDLSGILGAMRSFALAELRKVGKRETAQQVLVENLFLALADLAYALPPPTTPITDIGLLFGSVRGFCGSFNEEVLHYWSHQADRNGPVIIVGERLHSLWDGKDIEAVPVLGAHGGMDAVPTIERIVAAISGLRHNRSNAGLIACFRDQHGVCCKRLLPIAFEKSESKAYPPFVYTSPAETAAGIVEHFLFHQLLALLLRSLKVENHMRLLQMENALRHLDEGGADLTRRRNRLRQEEIVEEIELMTSAKAMRL